MKNPLFHKITLTCIQAVLLFLCQSFYQLSYAQYNIVIKKISPSFCYRGGEAIDIYGSGFGKKISSKILIFNLDGKEYLIDKIKEWSPSKISAVIPSVSLTNKERSATIGIRIRSTWASNRDKRIRFCSQLKTARTPFNTQINSPVNRELRTPPKTPFSSTLSASPPRGTVTPEDTKEDHSTAGTTPGPETVSVSIAENTEAPITPRGSGSLTGLGTPPKVKININPDKVDREQQEPKEIMVISASMDEAVKLADLIKQYNIRIKRRSRYSNLGIVLSILAIPAELETADIVNQLREYDPNLWLDFNHRYKLLASTIPVNNPKQWAFRKVGWNTDHKQCGKGLKIGLIDTGVSTHAPINQSNIIRHSFLPNGVKASSFNHGTAIASLLLGSSDNTIAGLIPEATLYSASIFRQRDKKHSDTTAEFIIASLNWLVGEQVKVINMSLGGPRNLLVELALRSLSQQNFSIISAAGIDENKNPLYPAAQKGVIAVRAIDTNDAVLSEKIKGHYIDFSAPGVDIWLLNAKGKGKYLSGSSFAAPFVAASYLLLSKMTNSNDSSLASRLKNISTDLGDKGKDPYFGFGLISLPNGC